MNQTLPLVTVLIPARDEEANIEACLAAVAAQDWPWERLEVLVVDGSSHDATAELARRALAGLPLARGEVLHNEQGTTPSSLNVGLAEAKGDVVCRVDVRSFIPSHYVRSCVDILRRPDVAVVGGAQVARAAPGAGTVARGIARALCNPWAMGGARYRRRVASGPTDTVYLGAFRTDQLRTAGGWDERLGTNQDYELNRRMGRQGFVWYEASLKVEYCPRATLRDLARQYRRFGRWKAASWLELHATIVPRQVALVAGPPLGAAVTWRLLRHRPGLAISVAVAGGLALDVAAGGHASLADRSVAVVAMGLVAGAWWEGVVEQAARHIAGQRLLHGG